MFSGAELFELIWYRVLWVTPMLNYFEFELSVHEMLLFLALVAIFSKEWNHLSNFGGHFGENLCEIKLGWVTGLGGDSL